MNSFVDILQLALKDLEQYVIDNMGCVAYLREQEKLTGAAANASASPNNTTHSQTNSSPSRSISVVSINDRELSYVTRVETNVLTTEERDKWANSKKNLQITRAKVQAIALYLDSTLAVIKQEVSKTAEIKTDDSQIETIVAPKETESAKEKLSHSHKKKNKESKHEVTTIVPMDKVDAKKDDTSKEHTEIAKTEMSKRDDVSKEAENVKKYEANKDQVKSIKGVDSNHISSCIQAKLNILIANTDGLIQSLNGINSLGLSDKIAKALLASLKWFEQDIQDKLTIMTNYQLIRDEYTKGELIDGDTLSYYGIASKVISTLLSIVVELNLDDLRALHSIRTSYSHTINMTAVKNIKDNMLASINAIAESDDTSKQGMARLERLISEVNSLIKVCSDQQYGYAINLFIKVTVGDITASTSNKLQQLVSEMETLKQDMKLQAVNDLYKQGKRLANV